jgi:hypothetical protein
MADLSEKEILNQIFRDENKKYPIIDAEPEIEIKEELTPFLEKVEKEQYLQKPITDDYGQPIISAPAPQQPKIILPISQNQYNFGLTQKVTDSVRWLAEWCQRLFKIFGNRIVFRETTA